ncbi:hypothetical protein K450DRAFT_228606 [Umbelopsis ramanniana AG]|uniref:Uncharacterized protein n=1 Tax=Umbelopsis ramanniana AG TaxID=1314678 RepID=A0AAD5HHM5_UMBRA|nr:uncharacterized protein K450DRAFT_228606 [Umbelopsis ramanniana AG]KAI8582363.1 hypothetical protein K450DRAFT_228606 [Umbelopsis ramanniana AG]
MLSLFDFALFTKSIVSANLSSTYYCRPTDRLVVGFMTFAYVGLCLQCRFLVITLRFHRVSLQRNRLIPYVL